jgi:hypothetical protein
MRRSFIHFCNYLGVRNTSNHDSIAEVRIEPSQSLLLPTEAFLKNFFEKALEI